MHRDGDELPLAVVIGQGEYSVRVARLFRDSLSDECMVVTFPDTQTAAQAFGCLPGPEQPTPPPQVALLAVVVGDDTPTADEMTEPFFGCPAFKETRLIVLTTALEISGVARLMDRGWLDWVGSAAELRLDAFLESMRAQIALFHEHTRKDGVPQVSTLFDLPFTDSEIIAKVMRRIEATLGAQPRIHIPAGVHVARKGEWVEELTLVLHGSVALIHEAPSGDIIMHEESTGRIVGLLAVSEGRRAFFNGITTSDAVVVRLTVEQLNLAIQGQPDITLLVATLFIRSLDRRLRRAEALHIENVELSEQVQTERAHLATALSNLEQARTELFAQERLASLGALSAGVAHELNNPMAAIKRIGEYLDEDVAALLATAPDRKWSKYALGALRQGMDAPSLSSRAERELRREFTEITGDPAVSQRLTLAGIHDPKFAKRLGRRGGISLEGAEQAASIGVQLRNLNSAADRITRLVASLRSYARPDGDVLTDVNLHDNLDDSIRLLSHKLTNVEVQRDYEDLPTFAGHPGELAQVWTNVLTNAAEAIEEQAEARAAASGEKPVAPFGHIKVTTSQPSPDWLRVVIEDDGPGIPKDILARVFEPRFTTKSGQVRFGMGVGLGVARNIVTKHHGTMRINADSDGTTITVDLPVARLQEDQ